MKHAPWTPPEDAILRAHYPIGGAATVQARLPHRGIAAIRHRSRVLGAPRRRFWNDAEDARLRELWTGALSVPEVGEALDRSSWAVYERAQAIGLPLGVVPGWESVTHAAERKGFSLDALRRVLVAAGVTPRPTMTEPGRKQGRCRYTMVRPAEVDAVVRDWMARDNAKSWAQRLGVHPRVLRQRLIASGLQSPRWKTEWRVTEAEARRALGFHVKPIRKVQGREERERATA